MKTRKTRWVGLWSWLGEKNGGAAYYYVGMTLDFFLAVFVNVDWCESGKMLPLSIISTDIC